MNETVEVVRVIDCLDKLQLIIPNKYSPCLFGKMKKWFTLDDVKLLSIILHMSDPAKKVFIKAGDIPEPLKDDVQMNKSIYELYKKIKKSKERVAQFA